MTAQIIPFRAARRPLVRAQCEAVSLAEAVAIHYIRWSCAVWRDSLRAWWGV